ncbi:hypothetical protein Lesp02_03480 [Lentzea sp. NBRC 105346]|uniref:DUF7662 domain-containing protein n=1 Tax=Lentzea sp. NBRC 105346 TaxID=3032205 RepID=UPI0024A4AFF6|nr:hypothetical protein [Lentzea sp. NBRC 105346]GLZ28158.1 hypothetical protein Lesp02_03480 [Lentzea sp. NBRC 105346]
MPAKYAPLTSRLAELAAAGRETAEFDFAEIADLVGGLPPTAYDIRQWWGNSSSVQAQAWRDADWHVAQVDFARRRVRFERGPVGTSYGNRRPASAAAVALAVEMETAELDVQVRMSWQQVGEVTLGVDGELVFPPLPRAPGVYRISLSDAPGQVLPSLYVGESDNLRNRPNGYRRPDSSQQTNLRLRAELLEHLSRGGRVTIAVVTSATVDALGKSSALPLARKSARVFAEHAALALIYLDGTAIVLNRDKGGD